MGTGGKPVNHGFTKTVVRIQIARFRHGRCALERVRRCHIPAIEPIDVDQSGESFGSLLPASIERIPLAQPAKHGRAFQGRRHIGNLCDRLVRVFHPILADGKGGLGYFLAEFRLAAQFRFPGAGSFSLLAQESLLSLGLPFFEKQPG